MGKPWPAQTVDLAAIDLFLLPLLQNLRDMTGVVDLTDRQERKQAAQRRAAEGPRPRIATVDGYKRALGRHHNQLRDLATRLDTVRDVELGFALNLAARVGLLLQYYLAATNRRVRDALPEGDPGKDIEAWDEGVIVKTRDELLAEARALLGHHIREARDSAGLLPPAAPLPFDVAASWDAVLGPTHRVIHGVRFPRPFATHVLDVLLDELELWSTSRARRGEQRPWVRSEVLGCWMQQGVWYGRAGPRLAPPGTARPIRVLTDVTSRQTFLALLEDWLLLCMTRFRASSQPGPCDHGQQDRRGCEDCLRHHGWDRLQRLMPHVESLEVSRFPSSGVMDLLRALRRVNLAAAEAARARSG